MQFIFFMVYAFVTTLSLWFFEGCTIASYWSWFITPTFEVKTPSVWVCVGLAMLVSLVTHHTWEKTFKDQLDSDEEFADSMKNSMVLACISAFRIFVFLFCGWIIHCIAG